MAAFKPLKTSDMTTSYRKTLLYSGPGWGKTTQAKHFKAHYGKGFIVSGEAGLSSIRSEGIDYLPFTSFDGPVDEAAGVYSFIHICKIINSPEFKAANYKWLMLDSLTELSDLIHQWAEAKAARKAVETGKPVNGFEVWGDYKDRMLGACKFIRDLPMHVILSALTKAVENEDGENERWPLVNGNAVQAQIPGIFDNVFCGATRNVKAADGKGTEVKRIIVTSKWAGWQGKVRDEHGVIKVVEETGNVIDLLKKLEAAEADK